jgi:hypothetical protein
MGCKRICLFIKFYKFQRIEKGDISLFGRNKEYIAKGIEEYKLYSRKLAIDLWSLDDDDQTWENIYFLSNVEKIKIPYYELNKLVGYNYVLQGFNVLDRQKSFKIINMYNF